MQKASADPAISEPGTGYLKLGPHDQDRTNKYKKPNGKGSFKAKPGAPNDNFRKNICSEDDLRSKIFGTFVVKFLA